MKRCIVLAALLTFPALAQSRFALDIHRATVALTVPNDLQLHCSSSVPIEACTEILGVRLDCRCRSERGRWVLAGNAQMIPYMYLSSIRLQSHERNISTICGNERKRISPTSSRARSSRNRPAAMKRTSSPPSSACGWISFATVRTRSCTDPKKRCCGWSSRSRT